jgi:hypothetical protein
MCNSGVHADSELPEGTPFRCTSDRHALLFSLCTAPLGGPLTLAASSRDLNREHAVSVSRFLTRSWCGSRCGGSTPPAELCIHRIAMTRYVAARSDFPYLPWFLSALRLSS